MPASQNDQGSNLKEAAKSLKSACHQAEERCEQRDAPVHRFKQVIEEHRISEVERDRDEGGCETQEKQRLVRQDVGRCCRDIASYHKPALNEVLAEYCCRAFQQVQDDGYPGHQTRRYF